MCAQCAVALPAGTRARWFADTRTVQCLPCVEGAAAQAAPEPPPPPAPVVPQPSSAGASAQREYERRSARELAKKKKAVEEDRAWREQIKQERPVLGRVAAFMTEKPTITPESQSTKAWKVGAEGERRVGERLDGLEDVLALHDLAVPNSRANIDHIAIAATGLYVVDAKKYKGQIECRNVGGFFKPDNRLFVGGRDRTKLVDGVLKQMEIVRNVLGADNDDVPIRGALCFVEGEFGLMPVYFSVKDVNVVGLRKLSKALQAPGDLSPERRQQVAQHLSTRLRPAAPGAA